MIYDLEFAVLEILSNFEADVLQLPQTAWPGRKAWDKDAGKSPFSLNCLCSPPEIIISVWCKANGKY